MMTESMLESHFDDDSSTQASEPSLRESTRPSRSNTPASAKSLTPRGSFTQHPLEAGGEHEGSMSDLDIASQNPHPLPAILVMGVTGAGKSHFIRVVTGDSAVAVGHNLRSGTRELQFHRKELDGKEYEFVDTPGFNDPERSEFDIVFDISDALGRVQQIMGILYLHRISDDRMLGSSIRHLRIFRALCGSLCMKKVIILTTHWDMLASEEVGQARESELQEHYWRELIADGARVERFEKGSPEEAERIIKILTQNDPKTVKLAILEQILDHKSFAETDVGRIINEDIQRLQQRKEEESRHAREEEVAQQQNSTLLGEPQTLRERILMENYTDLERRNQELREWLNRQVTRSTGVGPPRGSANRLMHRGPEIGRGIPCLQVLPTGLVDRPGARPALARAGNTFGSPIVRLTRQPEPYALRRLNLR